jgi:hypothetical protein
MGFTKDRDAVRKMLASAGIDAATVFGDDEPSDEPSDKDSSDGGSMRDGFDGMRIV